MKLSIRNLKIAKVLSIFIAFIMTIIILDIKSSASVLSDVPYSGSINSTITGNNTLTNSTELYLYPGDIVYFNFTYTPGGPVSFGVVTPSNSYKYFTVTSGSCNGTITISETGIHKIQIRSNSASQITVRGTYSTGCSYVFKSSYMATKLSQKYNSSHYGIDIVADTAGAIAGYPIYSMGKGTVKVATYSSTAGYYVVVVGDEGYTSRYLHMNNSPSVSVGNSVSESTLLGYVGTTGTSTGYHLHLDVNTVGAYYGGSGSNNVNYSTTVDPQTLFPQINFN